MNKAKPTHVVILGAGGQIAMNLVSSLKTEAAVRTTLFLRNAFKLKRLAVEGMSVVEGDISDDELLRRTLAGQDLVVASLSGDMESHAHHIVKAMKSAGVRRLVFVASLGIYDEIPGEFGRWNKRTIGEDLKTFRRAADYIESSGLDTTIVRPAWLTDDDEVSYETTSRREPFRGTEVSRKSVADYLLSIVKAPAKDIGGNIGINKPGTDGNKPAFM